VAVVVDLVAKGILETLKLLVVLVEVVVAPQVEMVAEVVHMVVMKAEVMEEEEVAEVRDMHLFI
jgi:hypothetical protein